MLNRNLDLDIEDYVSVNFLAMADVVDALDGVDIELTDEEVVHMNNYCVETSEVTGKSYERIEPEVWRHLSPEWCAGGILCPDPVYGRRRFLPGLNGRDF